MKIDANIDNKHHVHETLSAGNFSRVCYPFISPIRLCVDLQNLRMSYEKKCFSTDMFVVIQAILGFKVNVLDKHIGFNENDCSELDKLY